MQAANELCVRNAQWHIAVHVATNLSELQLFLGDIRAAIASSQLSLSYANRIGNNIPDKLFLSGMVYDTYANVLYQAGENALADSLFIEAEKFQRMQHPKSPQLFSRPGFYYCDFLLAQNRTREVMRRARYALNISLNP
ncbi:MAG: hypothetical protein Q7T85_00265, partial [Nitrosomonas sp.]|nr:hypothetical protein [Nitrosomonas sp.]